MVYQRFCGMGKTKNVALIAYTRKLPTLLQYRRPWRTEQPRHAGQLRSVLTPKSLAAVYSLRYDMGSHYGLTQRAIGPC